MSYIVTATQRPVVFEPLPTAGKFRDLTNLSVERLIVLGYAGKRGSHLYWFCECQCGNITIVSGQKLREKRTKSCGCLAKERIGLLNRTHGESGNNATPEFRAFMGAKNRCNSNPAYKNIEFKFQSFAEFLDHLGRKPTPKHTLDRYPNQKGHYEIGNVRWATVPEQNRNRSSNRLMELDGIRLPLSEWCEIKGVSMKRTWGRLQDNWCFPCALSVPLRGSCPHQ